MDELGLDSEPPEEGACPNCGGRGRIGVVLTPGEYRQVTSSPNAAERPPERRSGLAEVLANPRGIVAPSTPRCSRPFAKPAASSW